VSSLILLIVETKVLVQYVRLTVVLYQARIHPEQYSNTLPKPVLKTLHEAIHSVSTIAANVLGDSSKFPDDWLFSYRWGKSRTRGKKGQEEVNVLPSGEKIKHITVGGRTSAVVESRQKKLKGDDEESEEEEKSPPVKKGKKAKEENQVKEKPTKSKPKRKSDVVEEGVKRKAKEEIEEENITPKKPRIGGRKESNGTSKDTPTRKSSRSKA
jgi:formamidopyrimidine-DNA glycosylase